MICVRLLAKLIKDRILADIMRLVDKYPPKTAEIYGQSSNEFSLLRGVSVT